MNKNVCVAAFLVGLLAIVWVGVGYLTHPVALTMTTLIAAVYLTGAREMFRFRSESVGLAAALQAIPQNLSSLSVWLNQVPPALQNPVRLRVEGERTMLPGPALTPYLIGLLVMLGMLGTFLGMVVTLSGVGLTLENTTDLHTIRSSLSAPIKGLGLAFGTSVAGVSASAMLGFISALCRRERQNVTQLLDAKIASSLRDFSSVHQREETYKALRLQAQALPDAVEKLGALMASLERQQEQMNERLLANQQAFHQDVKVAYTELAATVGGSLKSSLTESARAAGEALKPYIETTLAGIGRETETLQARLTDTVKTQLDGLSERFGAAVQAVESNWNGALANQERSNAQLNEQLGQSLNAFNDHFEQRSAALLDKWSATLANQERGHEQLNAKLDQSLTAFAQTFDQRANALVEKWDATMDGQVRHNDELNAKLGQSLNAFSDTFAQRSAALLENWSTALAQHEQANAQQAEDLRQALSVFTETFEQRSSALVEGVQREAAARDEQRLAALSKSMEAMAAALKQEWQQAGEQSLAQQQQICATLEKTAGDMAEQARAHAADTIGEIAKLMETASEAARAAAEVIGQLRQEISNGIARDNALLDERARILETLNALLEAINHAAAEQRGAIDSLVASSADVLQKVSAQFTEQIGAESGKIAEMGTQLTASAVEVGALGETLGFAVQQFGEANGKMIENLQRIEASLEKSMSRSDEQMAYYVAQAREIIDLSILSQKQVVEDLQKFSAKLA